MFTYEVKGASGPVDEQQPQSSGEQDQDRRQPQHPQPHDDSSSASEPPRVGIIGSKEVKVSAGASTEIRCEVHGTSQAELVKHGEQLPVNHRITKSGNVHILSLQNLKESDSGYYLCNAQNSHGPARDYLYLQVTPVDENAPSPPRHHDNHDQQQQPHQPEQTGSKPLVSVRALTRGQPISLGQELRLVCYVDDAEAQVDFARADGQPQDERRVRVEEKGAGVRELVISSFEAADAGSYRCTGRNRNGQSSDVGHVQAETDNTFTFKTEKQNDLEVSPGNPHVTIRASHTPRENSPVEVECRLEEENGIPANSFSWAKFPSMPRSARVEHNRLSIQQFDSSDNGLYTCRASTDEHDYEKTKLIASNDYLLAPNPFFRISKADEGIEVKCRPDSEHSTYSWKASESSHNDENSYTIEGDRLVIYESAANHPHTFACLLNTDSEFGPISIELDVNQELIQRALNKQQSSETNNRADNNNGPARLYVDEHREGHNSYIECQPGEDC